jgi:transcriptional regulator with XRE-family HTH domain
MSESTYIVKNEQDLGFSIRSLRLAQSLTQDQLAKAAGVSRAFVIGLEHGNKPGAELSRVLRVLQALEQHLVVEEANCQSFGDALQQIVNGSNL